ncbi:sensor histidine kinase [Cellulophaga omnivescoria]|uniref:sensor histidine kinase n=1 Tax=Cellulophaga omnivescoria TaxID=1888890 RepID=UPI000986675C|nr:ATP-binding protein [Cellulophaga omnivescoria]
MVQKWWKSYTSWFVNYSNFKTVNKKKGLEYFRDKLFISILLLTFFIGGIAYFPSGYVAIARGELFVLYIDTLAILALVAIIFINKIDFDTKKIIFSYTLFVLSFGLLLHLGFKGNGSILLYTTTSLITLYKGRKEGINWVLTTVVLYIILLTGYYFNLFYFPFFDDYDFEVLAVVTVNNVLFNFILVFSISFLIKQLHQALIKENKLQKELVIKHNKAVLARQKAESSDKLKSAFLANISHEIGTPMYGILGSTDFLKELHKKDKESQEYLQLIEDNGNKLLAIIEDIVNISKIESGLVTLNNSTFNINNLINSVFTAANSIAKTKGIQIKNNNLISNNEALVHTDKEKLTTVLKHLLNNAIKYTEQGTITLRCYYKNFDTIEFSIKDTGIGIPKDKLSAIFKAFYQVDTSQKNALHGAGIGLAIAKAYTEMLGGKITLENNQENGATFKFTISAQLNKS